jgi:hypothetical protein
MAALFANQNHDLGGIMAKKKLGLLDAKELSELFPGQEAAMSAALKKGGVKVLIGSQADKAITGLNNKIVHAEESVKDNEDTIKVLERTNSQLVIKTGEYKTERGKTQKTKKNWEQKD